jgi:hypothetical protein
MLGTTIAPVSAANSDTVLNPSVLLMAGMSVKGLKISG